MSVAVNGSGMLEHMAQVADTQYRDMVCRLASGEDIDLAEVRSTLLLGGRNMAMLRRDVERLQERRAAGADRARADCLDSDLADAETERDLAVETLRSAEAEVSQRLGKLREVVATATAKANGIRSEQASLRRNAEAVLLRTADPGIDAKIAELRAEASDLDQRRGVLSVTRGDLEHWRAVVDGRIKYDVQDYGRKPADRVAELEGVLKAQAGTFTDSDEARLAAVEAEIEQLTQSKMDPENVGIDTK